MPVKTLAIIALAVIVAWVLFAPSRATANTASQVTPSVTTKPGSVDIEF